MEKPEQLSFDFDILGSQANQSLYSGRELGTFKDSMKAPIFRWFRYPAGYSYKFVFESFDIFDVSSGDHVYDPFSGTGTTLICAKYRDINAYGVEAHSFVHWVADVKLYWEFDYETLRHIIYNVSKEIRERVHTEKPATTTEGLFPDLIYKCYHPDDLKELLIIRNFIDQWDGNPHARDLLKLALTDALRGAAVAQTGWPYIKPRKQPESHPPQKALTVFMNTLSEMLSDLRNVSDHDTSSQQINKLSDSRMKQDLETGQVDFAITSPPYLNNYDYADRTRLETYFWGITQSWRDITRQFRDKLMVAATTQITRSAHDIETVLSSEIKEIDPMLFEQLQSSITRLSQLRLQKSGKKNYDLMVALYFNDILKVLQETYRVLKKNSYFCLVLGDSAPYGEYIPTDEYIGKLALGTGFSEYRYHQLRQRGGKWRANPQRHSVKLREGIVILKK